ncbi:hypothetical protein [Azohydromonas lata]|uniref:hypothetical protein n=1 Tax=Azohydromonas lata TaxID=45677 RepID=UPI0012F4D6FF|nr:hypothetical protein [Azohydromonas lata]
MAADHGTKKNIQWPMTECGRREVMMLHRVISVVAVSGLCACSGGTPGHDEMGLKYQKRATPVLQALALYERDHSSLPDSLDELTPAYLNRLPTQPELSLDAKSRQLSFTYAPSLPRIGKINCYAQLGDEQWSCQGYL